MRIIIPVSDEGGLNAQLSRHFGRAPYLAVVDLDENGRISNLQMVPNESEHFGGFGRPSERILRFNPHVVITYELGPRAIRMFQNANIAVLQANADVVKEVIAAYNRDELTELTEGCRHARHR